MHQQKETKIIKDEIKNLANNIRKNIMDNASKEEVNNYINNALSEKKILTLSQKDIDQYISKIGKDNFGTMSIDIPLLEEK